MSIVYERGDPPQANLFSSDLFGRDANPMSNWTEPYGLEGYTEPLHPPFWHPMRIGGICLLSIVLVWLGVTDRLSKRRKQKEQKQASYVIDDWRYGTKALDLEYMLDSGRFHVEENASIPETKSLSTMYITVSSTTLSSTRTQSVKEVSTAKKEVDHDLFVAPISSPRRSRKSASKSKEAKIKENRKRRDSHKERLPTKSEILNIVIPQGHENVESKLPPPLSSTVQSSTEDELELGVTSPTSTDSSEYRKTLQLARDTLDEVQQRNPTCTQQMKRNTTSRQNEQEQAVEDKSNRGRLTTARVVPLGTLPEQNPVVTPFPSAGKRRKKMMWKRLKVWTDLTADQRIVASAIGHNKTSWNDTVIVLRKKRSEILSNAKVCSELSAALKESPMEPTSKRGGSLENKSQLLSFHHHYRWETLTSNERDVALVLGYSEKRWNLKSDERRAKAEAAVMARGKNERGRGRVPHCTTASSKKGVMRRADDHERRTSTPTKCESKKAIERQRPSALSATVAPETVDYNNTEWEDLPKHVRRAARTLGYTCRLWSTDQESACCDLYWHRLTQDQKDAAAVLGYNRDKWDAQ